MKKIGVILSLLALQSLASALTNLKTVDYVDPVQYVGRWYQIARNPLPFEPIDCMCAQQTLGLQNDGTLSVYNSCNDGNTRGPIRDIRGIATNNDPKTNAQFTVDFGLPHKGQYWIIGLANDYRWAVVSDPSLLSLYILSKTPEMSSSDYSAALAQAAQQVDLGKLRVTNHVGCTYPQ